MRELRKVFVTIEEMIRNNEIDLFTKISIVSYIHTFPNNSLETAIEAIKNKVQDPAIMEMGASNGMYIRYISLQREGKNAEGHAHHHDHTTLVAHGRIALALDGASPVEYGPGSIIHVPKDAYHHFTCLTPAAGFFCVFRLVDETGEPTDYFDGRFEPYGIKWEK